MTLDRVGKSGSKWKMGGEKFKSLFDVHVWFYDNHREWAQANDAWYLEMLVKLREMKKL